jgi:hypothetical protein
MSAFRRYVLVAGFVLTFFSAKADVNVVEYHNHPSRDGLYIDPAFTAAAAAGLKRDLTFDGSILGNVYAQPLYIEGGPSGRAILIVVTGSDNVYALDAANGTIIWQRNVGIPLPLSAQPCGNINPLGIAGTPVADLSSRSLFFDAVTPPDLGTTSPKHTIYSFNVDTGTTNSGWPVDVNAIIFGNTVFQPDTQNQRGALAVLLGNLYVPYGGHWGDCGTYHGWLVGIPLSNPAGVTAWATAADGGGSWSVGGVASDGAVAFIATGNTFNANEWGGGEAIIRLQPGPTFSGLTADYWAPTNWPALDNADKDLGGSGPLLVNVPGATPSQLIVALGKDGNAYLLNRANLGGVSAPLAQLHVSDNEIIQAAATYQTTQGTYVVFEDATQLSAFRITPTSPPTITNAWFANQNGYGSPFVTSTDGTNNVIVWGMGSERDERLHGFDGDTGAVVYSGGGINELMAGTRHMNTAIAARGRIFVANDNKVYAFSVLPITNNPTFYASEFDENGLPVVSISFSQQMNLASISTIGNYNIAGASIFGIVVDLNAENGRRVQLLLDGNPTTLPVTLTISGITDSSGNAPVSSNMSLSSAGLANVDIGDPTIPDPAWPGYMWNDGPGAFTVKCEGSDIGNARDGFNFSYESKTNDFDVVVRQVNFTKSDNNSKGGLMIREDLTPYSRNWNIVNEPTSADGVLALDGSGNGVNTIECNCRSTNGLNGAVSLSWATGPGTPPNYPNAWLRLKRTGQILSAFWSTNADPSSSWTQEATTDLSTNANGPLPAVVYVGIACTAHVNDPVNATSLTYQYEASFADYNSSYRVPQAKLSAVMTGANIVISWTPASGTLQSSPTVGPNATWTPVGTANPATVPVSGNTQFFRVGP